MTPESVARHNQDYRDQMAAALEELARNDSVNSSLFLLAARELRSVRPEGRASDAQRYRSRRWAAYSAGRKVGDSDDWKAFSAAYDSASDALFMNDGDEDGNFKRTDAADSTPTKE